MKGSWRREDRENVEAQRQGEGNKMLAYVHGTANALMTSWQL